MPRSDFSNLHCSSGLAWLILAHLSQFWSVFRSSGPSNFAQNILPLVSISTSSIVYYNIEVVHNINIDFIVIKTQSLTHNTAGILVLNSYPGSHFCPGCSDQAQNWFWNSLKIKSPQKANPVNLSRNTPRIPTFSIFRYLWYFRDFTGGNFVVC